MKNVNTAAATTALTHLTLALTILAKHTTISAIYAVSERGISGELVIDSDTDYDLINAYLSDLGCMAMYELDQHGVITFKLTQPKAEKLKPV